VEEEEEVEDQTLLLAPEKEVEEDTEKDPILSPPERPSELNTKVKNGKLVDEKKRVCGIDYIDNIYCINLKSSKRRRGNMIQQFKKRDFKPTFIDAIHPRHSEYTKKYRNSRWVDGSTNTKRCFCQKPCIHKTRKLRPTEVAISFSHYNVYHKILRSEDRWALVCEDDVKFIHNFSEILNHVVPKDIWNCTHPSMMFCGGTHNDNYDLKMDNKKKFKYQYSKSGSYSNYCYILNKEAAKLLIKKFFPINRPEDSYKRWLIIRGKIDCYRIMPSVVAEMSAGRNTKSIYQRLSHYRAPSDPMTSKTTKDQVIVDPTSNKKDTKKLSKKPELIKKRPKTKKVITFNKAKFKKTQVNKKKTKKK